jgi:hypothetical protein
LSLFLHPLALLHFEFWIFCIFARHFACFHLHLCCEFFILIRVFLSLCFIVFSLPLHLALCFTYAPCCCVITPCFVLLFATTPCSPYLTICCRPLLLVAPYCSLFWLVCHNPSLGLATKARACKSVGQEGSPRVTFHAPGNVKECEGSFPHTLLHFGSWSLGGLLSLQRTIAWGQNSLD